MPPPAYRDPAAAFAAYLPTSPLPAHFVYDFPARTWRSADSGRVVALQTVVKAALETLHRAIDSDGPPFEVRAACASSAALADDLAALTSWDELRHRREQQRHEEAAAHRHAWEAAETRKRAERETVLAAIDAGTASPTARYRLPSLEPSPYCPPAPRAAEPILTRAHRDRLLRALSQRKVTDAVIAASADPAFRYRPSATADEPEIDPRAWLSDLPRNPGEAVMSSALYAAYVEALPPGARPLHERAFHALAVEVLGGGEESVCRTRRRGIRYYVDVSLPTRSI